MPAVCPRSQVYCRMEIVGPLAIVATLSLGLVTIADGQTATVRDSGGVEIVENIPSGVRRLYRVELSGVLTIGSEDRGPNFIFSAIPSAARLSDGSIAVADFASAEIRIFSSKGSFARKYGRRGDGPGEFRRLSYLYAGIKDTLFAWDAAHNRITVLAPNGRGVRTVALQPTSDRQLPSVSGLVHGGPIDDHVFAFRTGRHPATERRTVIRDTLVVALFSARGEYVRTVGSFLGLEQVRHASGTMRGPTGESRPAYSSSGTPFARETFLHSSADWLFVGDGDRAYEIYCFDGAGALKRIIRVLRPPRPVTSEVIARHRAQPADLPDRSFVRPVVSRTLPASSYPKTLPTYAGFIVDRSGRLWVKEYPLPGDLESRWNVFDQNGKMIGMVDTPAGLQITEIGVSYILGVWRDQEGVESVRLYTISSVQ